MTNQSPPSPPQGKPTSPRTPQWPRAYLLDLYNAAISEGCVRVGPIDAAAAKSLTQSLYRLRRRSDHNTAHFILPEFQLVTASNWSPEHGGTFYLMYTATPEGFTLPGITPVTTEEALGTFQPRPTKPDLDLPDENFSVDVEEINVLDYVSALRRSAEGAE